MIRSSRPEPASFNPRWKRFPSAVHRQRGLSLIEVLIAAALLLVVTLGIVPLLVRARADNVRGWEATTVTSHLKTTLDPVLEFDFGSARMTVPVNSTEELTIDFWTAGTRGLVHDPCEGWCAEPEGRGDVVWTRAVRVRQFNVGALGNPGDPDNTPFDEPLDGDASPDFVHLKEIRVDIRGTRQGGALGAGQNYSVTLYKAF
ncbi:MAG: prepilin-type N-terminal cleavage/methylation domain-containing protein [bacterium]|nr:prepilin-type N-terminal cleavage/methylation domain-containing protein [bacterium]